MKTDAPPEKKYGNFDTTFRLCSFFMAFSFLYPNRTNVIKRAVVVTLIVAFNGGQLFWFTYYTLHCLYVLDIINFSRNMTLAVILVLFFIKTYYGIFATYKFAPLLEKISADLIKANDLEAKYQELYDAHIREGKVGEIAWVIIPICMSCQFPLYAGILMSFESIQTDNFTRLMVHDMDLLFVEDIQSEAPFFHCIFAYNIVQCILLLPNFTGMDGSFCIVTTHLRLKLKLFTRKVQSAFDNSRDVYELRTRVRETIQDHQEALEFYTQIQAMYGFWLLAVFTLTSSLISFSLYQIHLLQRIDPKYTSFMMVGVFHIYIPCYYASSLTKVLEVVGWSKLWPVPTGYWCVHIFVYCIGLVVAKQVGTLQGYAILIRSLSAWIGEDVPDELYSVCWETWADPVVTKLLIFMICRAQKTIILTGNGIVVYNMELFKSIMQTSYSFFTLITT